MAMGQATIGTGSIVGTVTDPSGAVLSGAKVSITSSDTGSTMDLTTNSAGAYNSGPLTPGTYKVQITGKGFTTVTTTTVVRIGTTATVNGKMTLGQESTTVEVQASEVQVNTEQATVQGVLTSQQIENLPVNGRNFLDLAQLEPGVQIQDGTNFDPTKVGYSSISFGGRFGRTARISVDGVDVSDETVGTTTEDIPASAIEEFSLAQSSLDLSNELTSSGAVNVVTKSGTNSYHGQAFGVFRDSSVVAAKLPTPPGLGAPPYQQHQEGARFGGPIMKDKLFFFGDFENTQKHLAAPVLYGQPFDSYSGFWQAPFKDRELLGKLDYQISNSAKAFYRYSYFNNNTNGTFFASSFQVYSNVDYTRNHVVGLDFSTGTFNHSIRFSYLKFQNQIKDGTIGSTLPFANYPVSLNIGSFATGPNLLAPQSTPQSDHQIKYDGSKAIGKHILRFGGTYNHLQGGGFAGFFGTTANFFGVPGVFCTGPVAATASLPAWPCPNGPDGTPASNPLNYLDIESIAGNGQGFSTENKALGFPAGGLGPDNRLGLYIGDSWKVIPNLTVTAGVRYVRDTGRTDSDLGPIAALNAAYPGQGNRVKQANKNFAPQVGLAWDPRGNGKTVIRAGAGLFYENVIWNNVLFDRPLRLPAGAFLYTPVVCFLGSPQPIVTPTGPLTFDPSICSGGAGGGGIATFGQSGPAIAGIENQLKASYPFTLTTPNPSYVGTLLQAGVPLNTGGLALFDPNYKTPRSVQINAGIQREIRHGMVLSADYVRNVETFALLDIDINHVGDVGYFNSSAAQAAITATNASVGCTQPGPAGVDCAIPLLTAQQAVTGASPASVYLGNGLGTPTDAGGVACPLSPLGRPCAFSGINPANNGGFFLRPASRSVYNGLQMKLVQNVQNPLRGLKAANFQISYSLSKFVNPMAFQGNTPPGNPSGASDQDFVLTAASNNNPLKYMGQSLLDRTHQISFGGNFDVPFGFRLGMIGHFYSPLSSPVVIGNTGSSGQIFQTNFDGSGSISQAMPGTTNGSFGRTFGVSGLNSRIAAYNQTFGNQPTPAGQALIGAGLMTATQLQTLGLVAPTVAAAPSNQLPFTWLKDFDFKVAWRYTFKERFTIEPSVGFFNIFNFANYSLPPNTLNGWVTAGSNSINTTPSNSLSAQSYRLGLGTGVFAQGAPRATEWGLKFEF
jgi:hypothetical protein